jgi:hypothetical protein
MEHLETVDIKPMTTVMVCTCTCDACVARIGFAVCVTCNEVLNKPRADKPERSALPTQVWSSFKNDLLILATAIVEKRFRISSFHSSEQSHVSRCERT